MKMNPVVHFEMPAEDKKRMEEFYEKVFGWKMQHMGKEMNDYTMVQTGETGENGMPTKPGTINGGFFDKKTAQYQTHPSVVIDVENLEEHIEKVKAGGGTIIFGPDEVPGVGKFASFKDTEGNIVSMMESLSMG